MTYLYVDLFIAVVTILIPGTLTILNIYNCCSSKPKKEKAVSCITIVVGGIFYILLHAIKFEEAGDWNEKIDYLQLHNSISSRYQWAVGLVILIGFAGYMVLLFVKAEKLPPLISVISVAALILLNVFQIVYAIQIGNNLNYWIDWLLYVYHFNILLLSASVIRKQVIGQVRIAKNKCMDSPEHDKYNWIYRKMSSVSKYTIWVFIGLFFLIAIFEIIFVLCGQGIDAPIKAFTDTADWTFSKQTPPPPTDYDGHYLCTVAAGGHSKIVKPLRLGTRRGETIVVNRQLCIANAFEEYIKEKFPGFHRIVRSGYDRYGYPISKHITNPYRADIVYFIMKPLEWLFLIFLYLADIDPEKRISRQYKYCNK